MSRVAPRADDDAQIGALMATLSLPVLDLVDQLPEGLWGKGQRLFFECRSCGKETEFEGEHDDFDVHSTANVCGGSPRCCP